MESIRQKLKTILYTTQYCGLCLENNDNMSMVQESFEIIVNGHTHSKTLMEVIEVVFSNIGNILTNPQICAQCTENLLQSYIFIQNSIETTKIIINYVQDMYCKAADINKLLNQSTIESSNIVIVLENNFTDNYLDKTEAATLKKENNIDNEETDLKTMHSIFKCVSCNIKLPTYKLWREHKLVHKKKLQCLKNFKNDQILNDHYKIHSAVKGKVCGEIITDEKLTEHLGMRHEELHICGVCNTVYYSLNSLQTHEKICHVSRNETGTKCLMCLKPLKDVELETHKCKFACPECNLMPCIHYKYLIYYREQILNDVLQAKCLDCDYVCRKKEILLGHVNREHLNHHPYTCDKCGQQFYSKVILKAHIHNFHQEFYVCEFCDKEFSNVSTYLSHKKDCGINKRNFSCDKCEASFNTKDLLVEHKRRKHSKDVFPCGLCNKKFFKESKRKEHMVKVHSGSRKTNRFINTECVICLKTFKTKADLFQHMKTHGPNTKYRWRICNTEYDTLRQFRAHNRKHLGPFATCHVCGQEMRQILLKKHMTTHEDPIVTCETCGKSFQNTALLKYHQKVHLASIPCPKCKKLINPARLRRHWKAHLIDEDPELKNARKQTPNLKCKQCDYKTWNNILLECHMNRHHLKIKPYVCHICSKDFIGKHLLKKHLETHSVDKNVLCMVCLKSFANSACLKMHLRLHTGERPFTCEICGDRFRSSSIMNVHKLKKHSDKSNACPLCANKFYTVRDLRRHVIKVHWKQKKPFDPRELKGLEKEHYHLFHDGRRVKVAEEDVDFYMPS